MLGSFTNKRNWKIIESGYKNDNINYWLIEFVMSLWHLKVTYSNGCTNRTKDFLIRSINLRVTGMSIKKILGKNILVLWSERKKEEGLGLSYIWFQYFIYFLCWFNVLIFLFLSLGHLNSSSMTYLEYLILWSQFALTHLLPN